MREVPAKSLMGMAVFSITEGESIGVVKNIILDPAAKQLLALAVDRRGWYKDVRIVPGNKINNIGPDAVTIEEKANAERAANLPKMVKYMHAPANLVGNRVISDDGHTLGKVEEYYLNSETCEICRIDVSGGVMGNILSGKVAIKGEYILTIGQSAVMVDKKCLNNLEEIESRLQINLQVAKERTGQAWQATVSTSKKWGQNLSEKISQRQEAAAESKAKKLEATIKNHLNQNEDPLRESTPQPPINQPETIEPSYISDIPEPKEETIETFHQQETPSANADIKDIKPEEPIEAQETIKTEDIENTAKIADVDVVDVVEEVDEIPEINDNLNPKTTTSQKIEATINPQ